MLFETYRFANDRLGGTGFGYEIAVPGQGDYLVRLFFAEPFMSAPNQREFDVTLEGGLPASLNNLDLVETAGQFGVVIIEETVTVTDGVLNINFLSEPGFNNALAQAVAVYHFEDTLI